MKATQRDAAKLYEFLIRNGFEDWWIVNDILIRRWSMIGTTRVKTLAWERINAHNLPPSDKGERNENAR